MQAFIIMISQQLRLTVLLVWILMLLNGALVNTTHLCLPICAQVHAKNLKCYLVECCKHLSWWLVNIWGLWYYQFGSTVQLQIPHTLVFQAVCALENWNVSCSLQIQFSSLVALALYVEVRLSYKNLQKLLHLFQLTAIQINIKMVSKILSCN